MTGHQTQYLSPVGAIVTSTTEPTREDWRRCAEWCDRCQTWRHDEPGWAAEHHHDTGHTTPPTIRCRDPG